MGQFEKDAAEEIWPPNPAFFWKQVRANAALKSAFRTMPQHIDKIEVLCDHIDVGEWGEVKHDVDGVRAADMLYFAYAAGRISSLEFSTALNILNVREQYGLEVSPKYFDKTLPGGPISLPAHEAKWEFVDLLEGEGDHRTWTPDGLAYVARVADNLIEDNFWVKNTGREELKRKLMDGIERLPDNLQCGMMITGFSPVDPTPPRSKATAVQQHEREERPEVASFADHLDESQFPFNVSRGANAPAQTSKEDVLYVPSSGLMVVAFSTFAASTVWPAPCLGRVSSRQLAELHVRGFHPVITRDDRIKSNHTNPHDIPTGALDAALHDEFFHCLTLSRYTEAQRHACGKTLFDMVAAEIKKADEVVKAYGEVVLNDLADMAHEYCTGQGPAGLLNLSLRVADYHFSQKPKNEGDAGNGKRRAFTEFANKLRTRLLEDGPN